MKRIMIIAILALLPSITICQNQQQTRHTWTCTNIKTSDFEGYIFSKEFYVDFKVENEDTRYTPSNGDIDKAEALIRKHIAYMNREHDHQDSCPLIDENLKKYKRQYVGFTDVYGAKILWVNFVWDPKLDEKLDHEITTVEGGCSHYFSLKINLDTKTIYDLVVNEPGEVKYIKKVHKRRRIRY